MCAAVLFRAGGLQQSRRYFNFESSMSQSSPVVLLCLLIICQVPLSLFSLPGSGGWWLVAGGWWPPPWLMSAKTRPCLQSSPSTALANLVYTLPNSHYLDIRQIVDIKWGRRSVIRTLLVLDLTWHIQHRPWGFGWVAQCIALLCNVNQTGNGNEDIKR